MHEGSYSTYIMVSRSHTLYVGVTQPRISNLIRGKINSFGLDMLVQIATSAGLRVSMKVKKAA